MRAPGWGVGTLRGAGGGAGSDVLPELVAEGGLSEGLRREALVTPAFCFPTTTLVSEAPRFESIMEDPVPKAVAEFLEKIFPYFGIVAFLAHESSL